MSRNITSFKPGNTASVGNKSHLEESKFEPWMLETVIEKAAEGWSVYEICSALGISTKTWYAWADAENGYAQTSDWCKAVSRASDLAQAWWTRYGREHLSETRDFKTNDKIWALNMMVRFGWAKKEETTVKGDLADALKTMYDRINKPKA